MSNRLIANSSMTFLKRFYFRVTSDDELRPGCVRQVPDLPSFGQLTDDVLQNLHLLLVDRFLFDGGRLAAMWQ